MLAARSLLVLLCLCAPASSEVVPTPIPSAAVVQQSTGASPPPGFEHIQADMERRAEQLRDSQRMLRRALLGMLSLGQRELVAATIGQLAIAPDPDFTAAANQVDAALSPAQRETVARLVAAEESRREALLREMVAQSQNDMAALASSRAEQTPPLVQHQAPSDSDSPLPSGIAMRTGSRANDGRFAGARNGPRSLGWCDPAFNADFTGQFGVWTQPNDDPHAFARGGKRARIEGGSRLIAE